MTVETVRAIKRLRRKLWNLEDIADHLDLPDNQVRRVLGLRDKPIDPLLAMFGTTTEEQET